MCVGYVQELTNSHFFNRAGMRCEWSSRISVVLDIRIEEIFSSYVWYKWIRRAIEDHKAFRELVIS